MVDMLTQYAKEFISNTKNKSGFVPYAYYDKELDCIRVKILNCPVKEERRNKLITVLIANHKEQKNIAGFTIKGVKYISKRLGLNDDKVYLVTEILDNLSREFPDPSTTEVKEKFRSIAKEQELSVSFA